MRVTTLAAAIFLVIAATGQQPVDGTALIFTLDKNSITVRVGHWSLTTTKTAELNRFVDEHLRAIDPNKIIVYGDAAAKYPTFKPIIDVLKKHDWLKFKMEDTNRKLKPLSPKVTGDST
jgi:hypothetical protein